MILSARPNWQNRLKFTNTFYLCWHPIFQVTLLTTEKQRRSDHQDLGHKPCQLHSDDQHWRGQRLPQPQTLCLVSASDWRAHPACASPPTDPWTPENKGSAPTVNACDTSFGLANFNIGP